MPGRTKTVTNVDVVTLSDNESDGEKDDAKFDANLTKELVNFAQSAVKTHLAKIVKDPSLAVESNKTVKKSKTKKKAKKTETKVKKDEDDDIEILSESITRNSCPNYTRVPLKLPKNIQSKLLKFRTSQNGKHANESKIDLAETGAAELLAKAMKNSGINIKDCSMRISYKTAKVENDRTILQAENGKILKPKNKDISCNSGTAENGRICKKISKQTAEKCSTTTKSSKQKAEKSSTATKSSTQKTEKSSDKFGKKAKAKAGLFVENSEKRPNAVIKVTRAGTKRKAENVVWREAKRAKMTEKEKKIDKNKVKLKDLLPKQATHRRPPKVKSSLPLVHKNINVNNNNSMPVVIKKKKVKVGPRKSGPPVHFLKTVNFRHLLPMPQQLLVPSGLFVDVSVFNDLFSEFHLNANHLVSTMQLCHGDPSKDFLFDKWTITHISVKAAEKIFAFCNSPPFLSETFDQLSHLPEIQLQKVSRAEKTHLSQLSENEFCQVFDLNKIENSTSENSTSKQRESSRRKETLTEKFRTSPLLNSMTSFNNSSSDMDTLSLNLTSCQSQISFTRSSRKTEKPPHLIRCSSIDLNSKKIVKVKLRPKHRKLLPSRKTSKIPKIEQNTSSAAEIIPEEEIVIDVTEMSTRLCEEQTDKPIKVEKEEAKTVFGKAVRKFPSYGWCREKKIKATEAESKKTEKAKKTAASRIDMPTFQLAGLAETAPKEVEGWFTSKVNELRRLSEAKIDSNSAAKKQSIKEFAKYGRNGQLRVKVANAEGEIILDLAEYRRKLREEEEEEESNGNEVELNQSNSSNTNAEVAETFKVAKRIEKVSNQGVGRPVNLPNPNSFLPLGWLCRRDTQGQKVYVNKMGVTVKSIGAAIKHEASFKILAP